MEEHKPHILLVGITMAQLGCLSGSASISRVSTPPQATRVMRKSLPDVVVVRCGGLAPKTLRWLALLRAARPFLPIVACHQGQGLAPTRQSQLHTAGVSSVLSLNGDELHVWLSHWLRYHTAQSGGLPLK